MATVKPLLSSVNAMTCSLASTATGRARTGTEVDNSSNRYKAVLVSVQIKSQGTPTADSSIIEVWGLRSNNDGTPIKDANYADDTEYTTPLKGLEYLGSLVADGTATPTLRGNFRFENPGPKWNLMFVNRLSQTLSATAGDHVISWRGENDEIA